MSKATRLRILGAFFILLGAIAFGFLIWISTWPLTPDGSGRVAPGESVSMVKNEIFGILGQMGGGAAGLGLAVLIISLFVGAREKRAVAEGRPVTPPPQQSPLQMGISVALALAIAGVGTLGYSWYSYVTGSETPYDEIGIEINSRLPDPFRQWGCDQLKARFPGAIPPYGCADDSGQRWR